MDSLTPMAVPLGGKAKNQPGYQCCTRCVTDTTDPDITFDEHGVCNHCLRYDRIVAERTFVNNAERDAALSHVVSQIKSSGVGRDYDCVIGVSGGVDSTYVAYLVKQLGLRPLAVHMDNGWNSELAVSNIQKTLDVLGIDLYTEVLDWDEFRDLQLAFLKASTPDSEAPTDHAIEAVLTRTARIHGLKYIIGGSNIRTEATLPRAWSQGLRDWKYIRSVHQRFGSVPLDSFPHLTLIDIIRNTISNRVDFFNILNSTDYNKKNVMSILEKDLGWIYYGGKHYESVYTRFFQAFILPAKFKFDKRKGHLSTLICSNEITKSEALQILKDDTAPRQMLEDDLVFAVKKLGLTLAQFDQIMHLPPKTIRDYPAYENSMSHEALRQIYRIPRHLKSIIRNHSMPS